MEQQADEGRLGAGEEVKERSLPKGRGCRRWSQTFQRCTGTGREATGMCWNVATSDSRKEIYTERVVKGRRLQRGCEISVSGDTPNSTEL